VIKTIFVFSLSLGSLAAVAGNGSSYSGPYIGGDAIPTSTEERIKASQIQSSTLECLESLSEDIWNQLHRSNYQDVIVANRPVQTDENGTVTKWEDPEAFVTRFDAETCTLTARLRGRPYSTQISYSLCEPGPVIIRANAARFGTRTFVLPEGITFFDREDTKLTVVNGLQVLKTGAGEETDVVINNALHTQCILTKSRP
jgi:hypothetical protein